MMRQKQERDVVPQGSGLASIGVINARAPTVYHQPRRLGDQSSKAGHAKRHKDAPGKDRGPETWHQVFFLL
jgi:hypothetical protein